MGSVTSWQRGTNVTMTAAVSATGNHERPVLILPMVHCKNHMLTGAAKASVAGANTTGWPNERLCLDCLKNCIAFERSCKKDTVVLILDSYESHLSIPVVSVGKEDDISC